jgi:hypothetical protein
LDLVWDTIKLKFRTLIEPVGHGLQTAPEEGTGKKGAIGKSRPTEIVTLFCALFIAAQNLSIKFGVFLSFIAFEVQNH